MESELELVAGDVVYIVSDKTNGMLETATFVKVNNSETCRFRAGGYEFNAKRNAYCSTALAAWLRYRECLVSRIDELEKELTGKYVTLAKSREYLQALDGRIEKLGFSPKPPASEQETQSAFAGVLSPSQDGWDNV